MSTHHRIKNCRICNHKDFYSIIDLGNMSFTGQFPKIGENVNEAPLELVQCNNCDLVQLAHNFSPTEMYGDFYGYASSQNTWMIEHLKANVQKLQNYYSSNDLILDIGSNDATTLNFFNKDNPKIGFDPSAQKFQSNYDNNSKLIIDFFNSKNFFKNSNKKAKIITSYAMFYDLEDPVKFSKEIYEVLEDDGIWNMEQSYLPSMLEKNSFDTICHEHLEYYSFKQIKYICKQARLKIIDVNLNEANGGSFNLILCKEQSFLKENDKVKIFEKNEDEFFNNYNFKNFKETILNNKDKLFTLMKDYKSQNRKIYAIGASTKGNVLLQYYNINSSILDGVGEINKDKIGSFTPGSNIEIFHEDIILKDKSAGLLILPWHFKDFFINSEKFKKYTQIYPMPDVHVIN